MKIFTSKQIREIDAYTIKNEPVLSVDLMERAALALSTWIRKGFEKDTPFLFIAGPGNNGGDAWALARLLLHCGCENIRFFLLHISDEISPDSQINRQKLNEETNISVNTITSEQDFPFISPNEWIVDGLFGSGLSRPVSGLAGSLINYINGNEKAGVIAIDIPSGLFSESNQQNNGAIIKASFTLAFQFPKLAFLMAENEKYVGNWYVLPIGLHQDKIDSEPTPFYYSTSKELGKLIPVRERFSHKGSFGHALIISGSYGMMGAAVLACRAAVNSGVGLVTAHIPRLGYEIMQCSVPESLISLDESDIIFTAIEKFDTYNAIAIGPGLNKKANTAKALHNLLQKVSAPLVLDADALNILSENKDWLDILPESTILTPHPKEFDRLTKKHQTTYERLGSQIEFSKKFRVIMVLKGAFTSISDPVGNVFFNTTGNPGMATGGTGDVLTGMIVSLLAQGFSPVNAARIGVFIHGLAGDMVSKSSGYQGVTPTRLINKIGKAFKKTTMHKTGSSIKN
jgi:ADP-dependent NAD(P)H-hydrate dehydratase / NAD(P)H-hydrate epimerase